MPLLLVRNMEKIVSSILPKIIWHIKFNYVYIFKYTLKFISPKKVKSPRNKKWNDFFSKMLYV
jgi:hypothetical protein